MMDDRMISSVVIIFALHQRKNGNAIDTLILGQFDRNHFRKRRHHVDQTERSVALRSGRDHAWPTGDERNPVSAFPVVAFGSQEV